MRLLNKNISIIILLQLILLHGLTHQLLAEDTTPKSPIKGFKGLEFGMDYSQAVEAIKKNNTISKGSKFKVGVIKDDTRARKVKFDFLGYKNLQGYLIFSEPDDNLISILVYFPARRGSSLDKMGKDLRTLNSVLENKFGQPILLYGDDFIPHAFDSKTGEFRPDDSKVWNILSDRDLTAENIGNFHSGIRPFAAWGSVEGRTITIFAVRDANGKYLAILKLNDESIKPGKIEDF